MSKISSDQLAVIAISFALVILVELTLFNNGSVFLFIAGLALVVYSFKKKKKKQVSLWSGIILLFFAIITLWTLRLLIIGVLVFVLYKYLTKKEEQIEIFKHPLNKQLQPNTLIGTTPAETEAFQWRDIQIQRFIGDITLDVTQTILPHGKSIISIQQSLGKVRVIVPYEVTVKLHYSTLYGEATCFDYHPKRLINEQLSFDNGDSDAKRILVIYVTSWIGDVEVQRG
ncbi:MAG: cell wall-active antibiotics response protein LiaF [Solibacillus sp.]